MSTPQYEIAVIGGGPAGLSAAIALARCGCRVALISRPYPPEISSKNGSLAETKELGSRLSTITLFTPSVNFLKNISVWSECRAACIPIKGIRIVDDTGQVLRAPEVLFHAADVEEENFGYNIPREALVAALFKTARQIGETLEIYSSQKVQKIIPESDSVKISFSQDSPPVYAHLVVGADGKHSICRKAAGVQITSTASPQSALMCTFSHEYGSQGFSTEFQHTGGPFTVVPMTPSFPRARSPKLCRVENARGKREFAHRSSLVWVEEPDTMKMLLKKDDAQFRVAVLARLNGLLGDIGNISPRVVFPLTVQTANSLARKRIALVGEAGQITPPIRTHGLNVSLRDVASLVESVQDVLRNGEDPGKDEVLSRYSRARMLDACAHAVTVDVLNKSLVWQAPQTQLMRGLGLHALNMLPQLRRRVIEQGLASSGHLPALMRRRTSCAGNGTRRMLHSPVQKGSRNLLLGSLCSSRERKNI